MGRLNAKPLPVHDSQHQKLEKHTPEGTVDALVFAKKKTCCFFEENLLPGHTSVNKTIQFSVSVRVKERSEGAMGTKLSRNYSDLSSCVIYLASRCDFCPETPFLYPREMGQEG